VHAEEIANQFYSELDRKLICGFIGSEGCGAAVHLSSVALTFCERLKELAAPQCASTYGASRSLLAWPRDGGRPWYAIGCVSGTCSWTLARARGNPRLLAAPLNRRHVPMWGEPKAKCITPWLVTLVEYKRRR
jgi:hypothetical protein